VGERDRDSERDSEHKGDSGRQTDSKSQRRSREGRPGREGVGGREEAGGYHTPLREDEGERERSWRWKECKGLYKEREGHEEGSHHNHDIPSFFLMGEERN
jgi:hypothetical protein